MFTREQLTTEYLKSVGSSAFEITHLAIEVTRAFIRKGHQITVEEVLEMLRHRTAQEIIADIDDVEGPIS